MCNQCYTCFLSFIGKAILPIDNEICPHDSDEAFEGQTEVVIKSMYDVQKNIFCIAAIYRRPCVITRVIMTRSIVKAK